MNQKITDDFLKKLAVIFAENPQYTMKEIAEASGISKASLHRVYGTKENLVNLIRREAEDCIVRIVELLTKGQDIYDNWLNEIIRIHFENKEYILFSNEVQLCDTDGYGGKYIEALDNFFLKGKTTEYFSQEIEAAMMTELFISFFCGVIYAERKGRIESVNMESVFRKCFIDGIKK